MQLHRWSEVKKEQLNSLMTRQMIHGDNITLARFDLRKGAVIPEHSHINEQIMTFEKGRGRFVVGGQEVTISAGESLRIPPNVPHSGEVLEDSIVVDVFSPPREDWIRGEDSYLRK